MPWSKNYLTYPEQLRELYIRVMSTGESSIHTFDTEKQANYFDRMVRGLRYAFTNNKDSAYREVAPLFTTEKLNPTTIRICNVNETERGKLASIALEQRREQDKEKGVVFENFASIVG